jgi:hypothetical protein
MKKSKKSQVSTNPPCYKVKGMKVVEIGNAENPTFSNRNARNLNSKVAEIAVIKEAASNVFINS